MFYLQSWRIMNIFISGSDTNIGKTLISAWLCAHSNYAYYKPIQTGCISDSDSLTVQTLSPNTKVYPESYRFQLPLSPHLAAKAEHTEINLQKIIIPQNQQLMIEGAGGLLVPVNQEYLMIDLIRSLNIGVILVVSSRLGTINHSLLSIEALRMRKIPIHGVILSGPINSANADSIALYGKIDILAQVPNFANIDAKTLLNYPLSPRLKHLLGKEHERLATT